MDEMKEITDFSKARKNPFAEHILKFGYTTREHNEDGTITEIFHSPEEIRARRAASIATCSDARQRELENVYSGITV